MREFSSMLGRRVTVLGPLGGFLLATACTAIADPMGSVQGGGTVYLNAEHPTISLDRERLIFEPLCDAVRVIAELEFRNHDSACEVAMGFPVLTWHPGSGQDFVKNFTVEVDRAPLEVAEEKDWGDIELGGHARGCQWYCFDVPFDAGATRTMTVRYEERPASATRPQVPYVLATGGTWKGTIRDFELQVRLGDRRNFHAIELTGDDHPLPYEEHGSTLVWRCVEYSGKPEVLWFRAQGGPAVVSANGTSPRPTALRTGEISYDRNQRPLVWHDGRLLTRADFLADIVTARHEVLGDDRVRLTKENTDLELPATHLPIGRTSEGEAYTRPYVAPAAALEAFGGAISEARNAQGDAVVTITALPDSAASARQTALCPDQRYEYRLRCLRALAEQWPSELDGVAREILAHDKDDAVRAQDHTIVFLAAMGYLADRPELFATPESFLPRLGLPPDKDPLDGVTRYVVIHDDAVVRGVGLTLAALDAPGGRDRLIDWLINGQLNRRHNARGIGLALRTMNVDGACQAIMDAVRHAGKGTRPQNGVMAVGYLGDEDAVPFLIDVVRGQYGTDWGVIWAGTHALEVMGTEPALKACAQLAEEYAAEPKICEPLLRGLQRAVVSEPSPDWYYLPLPPWATTLSLAQAR